MPGKKSMEIPVYLFMGFLESGKTSFIQDTLEEDYFNDGERTLLFACEEGMEEYDEDLLKRTNTTIVYVEEEEDFNKDFLTSKVLQYYPDRVIIEPSGVGKLSDVIRAVEKNAGAADLELNSATTVVDVTKAKMYLKNFGEFFKNQVEAAGTIILSRMDTPKATDAKVEEALALIRELNPKATVITTPVEQLSGKKVLDTMEGVKIDLSLVEDDDEDEEEHEHHHHDHDEDEHDHCGHHHGDHDEDEHDHCGHHHGDHDEDEHDHCDHHHDHDEEGHEHHHDHCGCGHHHHHHHDADEVFTSWGQETIRKYTSDEISSILKALSADNTYGTILRAKGMVEGTDGKWIYFDMVPEEADVREGAPEYTGRLCVIGSDLKEDKLKELFKL